MGNIWLHVIRCSTPDNIAVREALSFEEPSHDRAFVESVDPHSLVARLLTCDQCDGPSRNVERFGEESDEGVVRGALDRWGSEADEDRATPRAVHARARGPRDDADIQDCLSSRLFALQ